LLPRPLVDPIAQQAAIRRRLVEDLELRDGGAGLALGAGLDPQLRALLVAVDPQPREPERLGILVAADRGLPRARRAVADGALVVVARRRLARRDEPAAGVAEPALQHDPQPRGHRVAGGVR